MGYTVAVVGATGAVGAPDDKNVGRINNFNRYKIRYLAEAAHENGLPREVTVGVLNP